MPTSRLRPLFVSAFASTIALAFLSGCGPRSSESAPATTPAQPAHPSTTAPAKPARLLGPTFTLIDQLDRTLECVILGKEGSRVLVKRTSDQATYLIELDRLSPATRQLLESYPDSNTPELQKFIHDRDYAEARRTIRVEMISTTWSSGCIQAKKFFATEGINYTSYDPESMQGKDRRRSWGNNSLPAVKIGDQIIGEFDEKAYVEALLDAYRQQLASASQP
jgi:hypothetical protein